MHLIFTIQKEANAMHLLRPSFTFLRSMMQALLMLLPLSAFAAPQETFATPEEAVTALKDALKSGGNEPILKLFGEEYKDLFIQPDQAASSANRARILAAMQTLSVLHELAPDRQELVIGDKAWPFPIPLVRVDQRWHFATVEGAEELLNRYIGANELSAIDVLRAYVRAQREYAARDRNGDGVLEFAQKLASADGQRDGLYWPADAAKVEEQSPFGPLIAASSAYLEGHKQGDAYRGYHFRILTRQGEGAAGGAYDYMINGRMLAGFAMVAYPAEYGVSGVMTFIVNQNGAVFEKDSGDDSSALGAKMEKFDSTGWTVVMP
jgi:hypothetical protein